MSVSDRAGGLPKKAVEAAITHYASNHAGPFSLTLVDIREALAAACDPSLGPDRLVPYGEARAEVVAETAEWLRSRSGLRTGMGHLPSAADAIERRERERIRSVVTPPVLIARCPEHGYVRLFDGRTRCPREVPGRWAAAVWKLPEECLIPLELVPMVPVAEVVEALRTRLLEESTPDETADFVEHVFGASEGER